MIQETNNAIKWDGILARQIVDIGIAFNPMLPLKIDLCEGDSPSAFVQVPMRLLDGRTLDTGGLMRAGLTGPFGSWFVSVRGFSVSRYGGTNDYVIPCFVCDCGKSDEAHRCDHANEIFNRSCEIIDSVANWHSAEILAVIEGRSESSKGIDGI